MSQAKPHMLVGVLDVGGEMRVWIDCPYEFGEPRPCRVGTVTPEAEACEWSRFEHEEHHETCPTQTDDLAECPWDAGGQTCWPEEPEECEGFDYDGEHMHPVPGCYAQTIVADIGWQEGLSFDRDPRAKGTTWMQVRAAQIEGREFTLPMPVHIDFEDDIVLLTPWAEAQALLAERKEQTA